MGRIEDLQKRYDEIVALERKAFWEATKASFDVSVHDASAYLAVGEPSTQEMHDRADELWKAHAVLDAEAKRILAEAFPASKPQK